MGGIVLFADCTHTLVQEVMDSFLKSFSSVFWLKQKPRKVPKSIMLYGQILIQN